MMLLTVKNPNEMQIEVISENDFDENGFCTKGDVNSTDVTMYVCPKCSAEIYSHALKMVDVTEKDDNSSRLACPKCGSHNLYFVADTLTQFEVNPDGSIGEVNLDDDGVDCICECAATEPEHTSVHCRDCGSAFHVEYSDDSKEKYKIGDEI